MLGTRKYYFNNITPKLTTKSHTHMSLPCMQKSRNRLYTALRNKEKGVKSISLLEAKRSLERIDDYVHPEDKFEK
jgi:hypothetical protein